MCYDDCPEAKCQLKHNHSGPHYVRVDLSYTVRAQLVKALDELREAVATDEKEAK